MSDGQHGDDARAIVGNSRSEKPCSLLPNIQRRRGGKHCIDMSAERNITVSVTRMQRKNVTDFIRLPVAETDLAETVGEPSAASRFTKRRRGDPRDFPLILREPGFVRAEPRKRGSHLRQR